MVEEEDEEVTICDSPEDETPVDEDEIIFVAEKKSEEHPPSALDRHTAAWSTQGFADFAKNRGEDWQRQPHPVRESKTATSESRRRGTGGMASTTGRETISKRFVFDFVFFLHSSLKFSVK